MTSLWAKAQLYIYSFIDHSFEGSSLENYRSNNTTQHKTTRDNTSATRDNTNTKQHKIYFNLFMSMLHTRSPVY